MEPWNLFLHDSVHGRVETWKSFLPITKLISLKYTWTCSISPPPPPFFFIVWQEDNSTLQQISKSWICFHIPLSWKQTRVDKISRALRAASTELVLMPSPHLGIPSLKLTSFAMDFLNIGRIWISYQLANSLQKFPKTNSQIINWFPINHFLNVSPSYDENF